MTAKLVLGSESFDKMFAGNKNAAKLAVEGVVEGVAADGKTASFRSTAALAWSASRLRTALISPRPLIWHSTTSSPALVKTEYQAELDKALDYAAHSVKKDEWYDRTLTFISPEAE
mgnify:CR=1 FL=1